MRGVKLLVILSVGTLYLTVMYLQRGCYLVP